MNFYAFSALVNGVACTLAGLVVYLKNPQGEKNRSFILFAIPGALWSFFYMAWQMSTTYDHALILIRISIFFAAWIPCMSFSSTLKILDQETPRRNMFKWIFIAITAITTSTVATPYFIPRVEQKLNFPYWPVPGPFMHIHFINLFIPSLWTLYLIWEKKGKASPLQRNKMKWLFISTLIAYTCGISNNFLWYNIPIKPYITIGSSLGVAMMPTVFFRWAAMDVNYLLKKFFTYAQAIALTILVNFFLVLPFVEFLKPAWTVGLVSLLTLLSYPFFKKLSETIIRRITKGKEFNPETIHIRREKIKESTYTYRDLAQNMIDLTRTTFPIDMAAVYFYDMGRKDFVLSAQKGMKNVMAKNMLFNREALSLTSTNPLIELLESTNEVINMEALLNDNENPLNQPLVETMNQLEAELCSPLVISGKLRGLFVIGAKKDNSLFDEEELETVRSFSQLGLEIMRYITSMETELNHTALYSHDVNHDIRSLMQTLQFLRSPMAKTAPTERVETLLANAERVAENLYQSFQTNRDRSMLIMKIIRGDYEKKPVNISTVLKNSTDKFSLQAEKDSVTYIINIEKTHQMLLGNEEDLTRVVDNLISNALRYVPKTGARLNITGQVSGKGYEIIIKDNGEGIEPENIDQIWKVGWQAKDSRRGAAGLGLAIVKQIVQIHNGTIQAISEGKGNGSEFRMVLPFTEDIEKETGIPT